MRTVTLIGFVVQLLVVSRIILFAGITRALMVTPLAFVVGFLPIGMVPVFMLLQSVLVVQRGLDYSLMNTARNALLLPTSRDVKYQAKTAIDTFFYRTGDLLSDALDLRRCPVVRGGPRAVRVDDLHPERDDCRLSRGSSVASTRGGTGAAQPSIGKHSLVPARSRTILFQ